MAAKATAAAQAKTNVHGDPNVKIAAPRGVIRTLSVA
jgi:hypothetical protein